MVRNKRLSAWWTLPVLAGMCLLALFVSHSARALDPIPPPDPKPGSYGLEAVKTKEPPKTGARITNPTNGRAFSESPITVSGICPTGLLVQVYNNNVMVGAVMCENGSFSVQVSLFSGNNDLSALVFDELNQEGPPSNTVRVTFNDTDFSAFGELMTLTSSYGRRSSAAGSELGWPLQLDGGTGPYAFSIDWGDGSPSQLLSRTSPGVFNIAHAYKRAGIYRVSVRVADTNGVTAFLQVIALANGKVEAEAEKPKEEVATKPQIMWLPTLIAIALMIPAFWLGRRSQVISIRNKMLKERDSIKEKADPKP